MPITDTGLLEAGREGIEVLLEFKGVTVTLVPSTGIQTKTVRGTHVSTPGAARAPQVFALNDAGTFDGRERSNNDEGLSRKRAYVMTGRYDAVVAIGDTFEDATARYTVETVDATSGYKTECQVTGYLKVVGHGPF